MGAKGSMLVFKMIYVSNFYAFIPLGSCSRLGRGGKMRARETKAIAQRLSWSSTTPHLLLNRFVHDVLSLSGKSAEVFGPHTISEQPAFFSAPLFSSVR